MKTPPQIPIYGDMRFRGDCPSEVQEQVTFFNVLRERYPDTLGTLALHPRNEGKRDWRQAARERVEGMAKGAADIVIPGDPAFVCELKRLDHTKCRLTRDEEAYLLAAHAAGAFACVALGWEAAMGAVEAWQEPAARPTHTKGRGRRAGGF